MGVHDLHIAITSSAQVIASIQKRKKKKKKKKEKRKVRLFSSKSQAGAFQCRSNYREDDCRSLAATTTTASQRASKSLLRLPQSHPFLRLGARRPQLCCDLTSVSALLDCLSPAGETRIGCRSLTATCLVCLPKEELVSSPLALWIPSRFASTLLGGPGTRRGGGHGLGGERKRRSLG